MQFCYRIATKNLTKPLLTTDWANRELKQKPRIFNVAEQKVLEKTPLARWLSAGLTRFL